MERLRQPRRIDIKNLHSCGANHLDIFFSSLLDIGAERCPVGFIALRLSASLEAIARVVAKNGA
jgi:hypothetical protein